MTESKEAAKTSLADALAKVQVTPGQAIALLNGLADGHQDRDPDLVASINKAITELSGGSAKEAEKEPEHSEPAHPAGTARPR